MIGINPQKNAQKSLRTMLIYWFLLITLTPVVFITAYSVFRYQEAIDRELIQRLEGNGREISTMISDLQTTLSQNRRRYISEPSLIYNLSTGQTEDLRAEAYSWINSDLASGLTFFNRSGRMVISLTKSEQNKIKEFIPTPDNAVFISDENMSQIKDADESALVEMSLRRINTVLSPCPPYSCVAFAGGIFTSVC